MYDVSQMKTLKVW